MDTGLEGKVALVTGGAGGIGSEAARVFARYGAKVAVADRDPEGAEAVARELIAAGGEAIDVVVDVTSEASVEAMVAATVAGLGGLDVAFNNAGILQPDTTILNVSDAAWDAVMDVNVKGVLYCLRHEILHMREHGGGAICNTGSRASLGAIPGEVNYIASKHAVLGLTRAAALEHVADGIRVNAVAPFFINTPMIGPIPDELLEAGRAANPSGRFGEPHEIAEAAVWLCSPAASYVSGVILPLDGGFDAL